MTDKEIIKALEDCSTYAYHYCSECGFKDGDLLKAALDLINRQQADNERLKKLLAEADTSYNKCAKRFYKEGIKEFAESLCKDRVSNDPVVIAAQIELKEWLGDKE